MERIGFAGLGTMGLPMAGHLLAHGHAVAVWNRTPGKVGDLAAHEAPDLAALAANCRIICLCVNRSEDVRAVVAGLMPHLAPGSLIVDHSTIEPSVARDIAAQLQAAGHEFLDAPITGGSMGAQRGTLTIFCGGTEAAFQRAEPYLQAYGKTVEHVGASGQGQMMKLANQIGVAGALMGLCESLAFAQRAGLDIATTHRLLSGGAAGSWAFDNYGPKILAGDWSPGFSNKNQLKDLDYTLAAADGQPLPMTELTANLLREMLAEGRGEEATASLYEKLRDA